MGSFPNYCTNLCDRKSNIDINNLKFDKTLCKTPEHQSNQMNYFNKPKLKVSNELNHNNKFIINDKGHNIVLLESDNSTILQNSLINSLSPKKNMITKKKFLDNLKKTMNEKYNNNIKDNNNSYNNNSINDIKYNNISNNFINDIKDNNISRYDAKKNNSTNFFGAIKKMNLNNDNNNKITLDTKVKSTNNFNYYQNLKINYNNIHKDTNDGYNIIEEVEENGSQVEMINENVNSNNEKNYCFSPKDKRLQRQENTLNSKHSKWSAINIHHNKKLSHDEITTPKTIKPQNKHHHHHHHHYTPCKFTSGKSSVDFDCNSKQLGSIEDKQSNYIEFNQKNYKEHKKPKHKNKSIDNTRKNEGELFIPDNNVGDILYERNIFLQDPFLKGLRNTPNPDIEKDPRDEPFDQERRRYPKIVEGLACYEGEWKNGMRDGFGILTSGDESKFFGYFEDNKAEGFGKFIHKDGDIYMGIWHNSQTNGLGIYRTLQGGLFMGEWAEDRQHGFGNEIWSEGSSYVGTYIQGNKEEYGILNFENNAIYSGEFEEGFISGIGTIIFGDLRRYSGQWLNNKMHGLGEIIWPDGNWFRGNFCEDKKEGFGVFCMLIKNKQQENKNVNNYESSSNQKDSLIINKKDLNINSFKFFIGLWNNNKLYGNVIIINKGKIKKQVWKDGMPIKALNLNAKTGYESYANHILQKLQSKCFDIDDFY